jgi:hypothetical protein
VAGFVGNILVCSGDPPASAVVATGILFPGGATAYVVPAYVVDSAAFTQFEALSLPFSVTEGAAFFSLGFGLTVAFWLLGQSLGVVVRPFWSRL